MSDEERSEFGDPIYRHLPRERPIEPAAGADENIEAIRASVEGFVGPVSGVFHEIVSDLVPTDLPFAKRGSDGRGVRAFPDPDYVITGQWRTQEWVRASYAL